MSDFSKLACIDLETTGTRPTRDHITEIAIVLVDNGKVVEQWQSMINPGTRIPEYIQQLTGITPFDVADAPFFAELAETILEKLQDRIIVAHNARFDTGFLRNALQNLGYTFDYRSICTVKLSRLLYPQEKHHNLDSIIKRFNFQCESRHRALGDALVLPQLLNRMYQDHGKPALNDAMQAQQRLNSIPPNLDPELFKQMPDEPGVYLFYGDNDALLYVGKSVQIRTRVLSHFSSDHSNDREMRIAQQVKHIEWQVTAGEFSALLLEAELVKTRSPLFNRQLRRSKTLLTITWDNSKIGDRPKITEIHQVDSDILQQSYGLFRSRRNATDTLRKLQKEHLLCNKAIGLEKGKGTCFAFQLKQCHGVCCGKETELQHQMRLQAALQPIKLQSWSYKGKVGIWEYNAKSDISTIHIIERWCYLGKANNIADLQDFETPRPLKLDMDFYRLCVTQLAKTPPDQLIIFEPDQTNNKNTAIPLDV